MKKREQKSVYATDKIIEKKWWLVDAKGQVLGRVATKIASLLRGKNKAYYTPSMDAGDFVVVINAGGVVVTGNKEDEKKYYRHSGYPGGLTTQSYKEVKERYPERIIEHAVKGMLPKTKLKLINHLKVYASDAHPHAAQNPETVAV